MSRVYSLKAVQFIQTTIEDAWDFFSRPENLAVITPATIGFKIKSTNYSEAVYAGQIIEYTIKPLFNIPLYWMTEIMHVQHQQYFVDEQRFGPYALWHHQHHFRAVNNGIEMTDIIHYKVPFWFIGDIANTFIVRKKLKAIFEYRYKSIEAKYGAYENKKCVIQFG